jgi:pimeloyl-ACP methyl ester carboxylesterase
MSIWTDLLGAEVKFYMAGEWKTRCIEAGDGAPLILIHGGGGHAEAYAKNVMRLAKRWHVYAIDALGHGLTAKPLDVVVNTETQAEHVLKFMDAAGIDRAHLAGESMGGAILGMVAYKAPDRSISYTSIVGAGLIPPEGKTEAELAERDSGNRAMQAGLETPTPEIVRQRFEWLFHDKSQVPDELPETRALIWSSPDYQEYQKHGKRGGGISSIWSMLPEIGRRTPTMFLWTENNPGTHVGTAKRAHELTPNSRFEVIKNSGHWPQWEQVEEFHRLFEPFLIESEAKSKAASLG